MEWLQSGIWLELLDLIGHGGVMILPIGICSVITAVLIIERWLMKTSFILFITLVEAFR